MDRLSRTELMSVQHMGGYNKSYYEPFQGFAYCILVINIDMQMQTKIIII